MLEMTWERLCEKIVLLVVYPKFYCKFLIRISPKFLAYAEVKVNKIVIIIWKIKGNRQRPHILACHLCRNSSVL